MTQEHQAENPKPVISEAEQTRLQNSTRGQPTLIHTKGPRLIEAVRGGISGYSASKLVGLHPQTYYNWLEWGRRDFEAETKQQEETGQPQESTVYSRFYQDFNKAEAEVEQHAVVLWRKALPDHWQAAQAFLARRFPDRWAQTEKLEVTGKDGGAVQLAFTINVTPEQNDAI